MHAVSTDSIELSVPFGPEQLLAVTNTRHGAGGHRGARVVGDEPDHDHLADPAAAWEFLRSHDVPVPDELPTTHDLERLRLIRDAVRGLVATRPEKPWPAGINELFRRSDFTLTPGGALRPVEPAWGGIIASLLPPLIRLADQRDLLKTCANPRCRFMFLDTTKNRQRVWCEMAVCGNRAKGQRFRARHVADGSASDAAPRAARARPAKGPAVRG